ncbi:uncharacterized protein LOC134179790 [Corticium candelabrum]|uniref:uncharacterized protein LOC134179790 n=1 Tax=Corticium candelabrum TaxID=121492 RepID=UPI002E25315F|nr:uncharacterized protein LOC134179790 [Corticium candelabrum]
MKLLVVVVLVTVACANPVKNCNDCSSVRKVRPVCGTDQNTYPSRCHLHRTACLNEVKIGVLHNGNCTGRTCSKRDLDDFGEHLLVWIRNLKSVKDPEPEQTNTAAAPSPEPEPEPSLNSPRKLLVYWFFDLVDVVYDRFLTRKEFFELLDDVTHVHCARSFFDDRCDANGDDEVSLHEWCVCLGLDDAEIEPYNNECVNPDLQQFNDRLIDEFKSEYVKARGIAPTAPSDFVNPQPEAEPRRLTVEKKYIYWKFDVLDVNPYSRYLEADELNGLTRYLQRHIRPYGCANTFIRRCDQNRDFRISLHEWCQCLGLDKDGNPITTVETTVPVNTSAPNVCLLQPVTGKCRGAFPRYYYSSTKDKCFIFTYGGCGGNGNSFATSGDCLKACSPKKECSAASLNDFNSKVLVFVDKMKRTLPDDLTVPPFAGDPKPEPEHQIFSPEKLLIYWLWDRLDVSPHDDVLTGQEVEAYITKLAATVTSRECVTSYFSRCDRNSDRKISLAEWCFCHGLDNHCPAVRRADFNKKILEFIRIKKDGSSPDLTVPPFHGEPRPEPEQLLKTPEKRLVYWMWDRLDVLPHDDFITQKEFQSYETETKIITPFACSNSYFSYCDRNDDSKISLSEWCFCHGLDNTCPAANLRRYNSNILEYMRLRKVMSDDSITVPPFVGEPKPEAEARLTTPEKLLVYWQWDRLDVSPHDDYLTRAEVSSYLSDVRDKVEPFGCGLDYYDRCDRNSDDRISLSEWCFCHGLDNVCPAKNRRYFNANILDYIRITKQNQTSDLTVPPFEGEPKPESESRLTSPEKLLVYWQWDRMDVAPHDDYLTRAETAAFMTKVKTRVEPFGCSLNYFTYCDRNSDDRISLSEWCFCHGLDNTCPAGNRRRFNSNILEYMKLQKEGSNVPMTVPPFEGEPEPESEPSIKTPLKALVYWQWDRLDISPHDDYLTKSEVKTYMKDVRLTVEPFGCGLDYFKYCDRNSDDKISLSEWCYCHGLDNKCPVDNRRRFNLNVLDYIKAKKTSYRGTFIVPPFEGEPEPESEPQINTPEKLLVYWQWDLIDVGPHDDYITWQEIREYLNDVRRTVEPFGCGISYWRHLDLNHDGRISLKEWCYGHGLDPNMTLPTKGKFPGSHSVKNKTYLWYGDKECDSATREYFNNNLLAKIALKYFLNHHDDECKVPRPEPEGATPEPEAEPTIRKPEKRLVYWQWDELDVNPHDDYLDHVEVDKYIKTVAAKVCPYSCGYNMFGYCDTNDDDRISRHEWCSCLGQDNEPDPLE